MSPALTRRLPWAIGALLVALLGVLAVLQLRWLDDVGDAERQRLEAGVETALGSLTGELDREVSRAVLIFRPIPPFADPETAAAEQWRRWNELSPVPELVRDVEVVEAENAPPFPELLPGLPGLSVPVGDGDRNGRMGRFRRRPGGEPDRSVRPERAVRVTFDSGYLEGELLPSLVRRHLAPVLGDDAGVRVTVERTGGLVYASSAETTEPGGAESYEWRAPVFRLLPPDELVRLAFATGARDRLVDEEEGGGERPLSGRARHGFRGAHRAHHLGVLASLLEAPPGWTLEVRPAEGSLDAALARARRGNATVVFGILLLLVLAAIALALSARRAQEMATRQMEFTAAVSHELRTPLAAIRSLADNLADGVVREPEQARRYGTEIARQGERLTSMVEQVLALASQKGARRPRETAPVDVAALVRTAIREATATATEGVPNGIPNGIEVEVDLADDLPPVTGDRGLLERAVANLVGNAVKHGAPHRSGTDGGRPWVGVRAARADGGGRPEVEIAVSDRGPGVPILERERLFEPFFRGAGARARQLPGSGLGLHLVRRIAEAHGGRVEVDSPPGGGSRFSLRLPASDVPRGPGEEAP
jgi:signal transduction histidine kinase